MPDFGFIGPSYEAPSIYQDAQECINFRPEVDPLKQPGQNGVVALYPTPGLTTKVTLNTAKVRGMRTLSGGQYLVVVCGGYVYALNSALTPFIIGQLNTTTGQISITDNGTNVYIVDGAYRYTWRISNPTSSSFIGSISTTVLNVTQYNNGQIGINQQLFGLGISPETLIVAQGTGSGEVGTYYLNNSQTISSEVMGSTAVAGIVTGSILNNVLTVTNVTNGTLYPGQTITGAGIANGTVIVSYGGDTVISNTIVNAGVGYAVNDTVTVNGGIYTVPASYTVTSISTGVETLGSITAGTGYTNGTYTGVQLTYVSGATATTYPTANIVVSGGVVTSVTLATPGAGFTNTGTVLTATAASIGGTGSGFSIPVTALANGTITGLAFTTSGSSNAYTVQPTNTVSTTTTGNGTGLTLNLSFGTGIGGTGTYIVSGSQTVNSETMYLLNFSVLPSTDGAFNGADQVDIVDNYFVYNRPGTQQWGSSNLLSPISNQLNFSSKDGAPDNLVSIIVDHREVYLLGESSSEVWVDSGLFPFPFQRIPGTSTQHGIVAQFSISRVGNSFAYLSRNVRGQSQVMMMNGYMPTRISTHAVENTLVDQYVEDAIAYTYQMEGHECYVLTFPTLDLTWVYDFTTGMWHKWLSVDKQNVFHRHPSNCHALFQNINLVGDYANGKIYQLDPNNYTNDGNEIRRVRRAPHLVSDYQRQYFNELQIYFQPGVGLNGNSEYIVISGNAIAGTAIAGQAIAGTGHPLTVGADPQAMLRWSDDGGSTWSHEYWVSIGKMGAYKNRAIWRRMGYARDRIFEVVVTDPINAVIIAANLKASAGAN